MADSERQPTPKISNSKKAIGAALITILIGAIGSGVWDIVAKPGLSKLGRLVLTIITFGSESVKDSAYASAAMDPTPLSSLVVLSIVTTIPLALTALTFYALITARRSPPKTPPINRQGASGGNLDESKDKTPQEEVSDLEVRLHKLEQEVVRSYLRLKRFAIITIVFFLLTYVTAQVGLAILNQAVLIRRVFTTNLAIAAPFLSDEEEEQYRAKFASLKTRAEYVELDDKLRRVTSQHGVSLLPYSLW